MYEAQIHAGAALLDERVPDWRRLVDPDRLVMRWPDTCILGQAMGSYWYALEILDIHGTDAVGAHGFSLSKEEVMFCDDDFREERWDLLTEEWKAYLRATAPAA